MSRRSLVPVAMVLALAIPATACGQPAETTAPSRPEPTTSTPVSSLTSQDVALAFFEAWQAGNREAMEQLSEPAALAQADGLADVASEPWEPELCEGSAGTVHCIWFTDTEILAIGVRNIEEPHLVTSFALVEP